MIQAINLVKNNFNIKNGYLTPSFKSGQKNDESVYHKDLLNVYLQSVAIANAPAINKIDKQPVVETQYKNNLRTMIQNNESVMMAIIPRTFTAEDENGDEKISLTLGEKPGTFLSAINRLDEIKPNIN